MASEEFIKITLSTFEAVIQYPVLLKDYCSTVSSGDFGERYFFVYLVIPYIKRLVYMCLVHICSSHEITIEKSCPLTG